MLFTGTWLYIGNLAFMDTDETNDSNENDSVPVGTWDSSNSSLVEVTANDLDGNGGVQSDDSGRPFAQQDPFTYNIGGTSRFTRLDAEAIHQSVITRSDGTTFTGQIGVLQMQNGDTFIVDFFNILDNVDIQSIEITTLVRDNSVGFVYPMPSFDNVNLICFARGTRIKTREGERLIEDLREGDMVLTMDEGYQPIRWIGGNKLGRAALAANDRLLPIRIRAGALGAGMPEQDLRVSPQHRVLVRSKIAQRMFGCEEVLVPAKKLLVLDGIDIDMDCEEVEYFHMLFDAHQIVFSNGAHTESLFTGPEALKAVSPEAREEILTLFPEIASPGFTPVPARLILEKGRQMKSLIARHAKNEVALSSGTGESHMAVTH